MFYLKLDLHKFPKFMTIGLKGINIFKPLHGIKLSAKNIVSIFTPPANGRFLLLFSISNYEPLPS